MYSSEVNFLCSFSEQCHEDCPLLIRILCSSHPDSLYRQEYYIVSLVAYASINIAPIMHGEILHI